MKKKLVKICTIFLCALMFMQISLPQQVWAADAQTDEQNQVIQNEASPEEPKDVITEGEDDVSSQIDGEENFDETPEVNVGDEETEEDLLAPTEETGGKIDQSETNNEEPEDSPEQPEDIFNNSALGIVYQAHVQDMGWMDEVKDGALGGTVGKDKHLEALKIALSYTGDDSTVLNGSVITQVHVQDYGWQTEVRDGQIAGTVGQNKPIEALRIWLDGQLSEVYDIYYRVHSARYGWFGWAKNGEKAGTYGYVCPMEAVEIKLYLKDDQNKPAQDEKSYLSEDNMGDIIYGAHIEKTGWQKKVADGTTAGTVGKNSHIEAVSIQISEQGVSNSLQGSVIYQAHVATIGWQKEVKDGDVAGTVGAAKQMEAIRIRLSGQVSETHDIYYRVHISEFGWLGWAKNGETAGSTNYACGMEAIEIKIIAKDSEEAPESGNRTYLAPTFIGGIHYEAYVEGAGWQKEVGSGETAGTTGQNKSIQAMKISVSSAVPGRHRRGA